MTSPSFSPRFAGALGAAVWQHRVRNGGRSEREEAVKKLQSYPVRSRVGNPARALHHQHLLRPVTPGDNGQLTTAPRPGQVFLGG